MCVLDKIGGITRCYEILKSSGWNKSLHALYMQKSRGSFSKEVAVLLLGASKKYKLNLTPEDFYDLPPKAREDRK